jgi:GT2 family glycosyltransferase
MNKALAICIPSSGRQEELLRCLQALIPELPLQEIEILVSDDSWTSERDVHLKALFPEVHYLRGPARGPATNRNFLAQHISADWIAFLDDDVFPDHGWYSAFVQARLYHPEIKVFEGRVYAPGTKPDLSYESPVNLSGGYLWSCNMFIEAKFFQKLGGFHESFPIAAMEDVELRYRIRQSGHEFVFLPQASVCHPWRKRGTWAKMKAKRDSVMLYLALHPEERQILSPRHYLWSALYGLVRQTLPTLCEGKCKGLCSALLVHLSDLMLAFRIACQTPQRPSL